MGAAKRDIKPAYFLTNKSIKGFLIDKSNCFCPVYFTFRVNCGTLFKQALVVYKSLRYNLSQPGLA